MLPPALAECLHVVGASGEVGRGAAPNPSLLPSPPSTSTTRLPSKPARKPGAGCGTSGRMCCDGRRGGRAPSPPGLQTQHCEGQVPPALGLLFMYSRVFNAWSCPTRGCPLFYFFNQKKRIKGEQGGGGGVLLCACSVAGALHGTVGGGHIGLLQPLSEAGLMSSLPGPTEASGWPGTA